MKNLLTRSTLSNTKQCSVTICRTYDVSKHTNVKYENLKINEDVW